MENIGNSFMHSLKGMTGNLSPSGKDKPQIAKAVNDLGNTEQGQPLKAKLIAYSILYNVYMQSSQTTAEREFIPGEMKYEIKALFNSHPELSINAADFLFLIEFRHSLSSKTLPDTLLTMLKNLSDEEKFNVLLQIEECLTNSNCNHGDHYVSRKFQPLMQNLENWTNSKWSEFEKELRNTYINNLDFSVDGCVHNKLLAKLKEGLVGDKENPEPLNEFSKMIFKKLICNFCYKNNISGSGFISLLSKLNWNSHVLLLEDGKLFLPPIKLGITDRVQSIMKDFETKYEEEKLFQKFGVLVAGQQLEEGSILNSVPSDILNLIGKNLKDLNQKDVDSKK